MNQDRVKMFPPIIVAGVVPAPLYRFSIKDEYGIVTYFEFTEVLLEDGKFAGQTAIAGHVFKKYFDDTLDEEIALYTHEQLENIVQEFGETEGMKLLYRNPAIDFQEQRIHN